jgi:tricorn protease interacting factor F2/3
MNDISPTHYKIHLEPDLNTFKFSGSTEILVEAVKPVHEISLNILDLAIWSCMVKANDEFKDCPFFVDPKKEELRVSFPKEIIGKINMKIDYVGEINNKMAGFYRSKYVVGGKEKYIAVTQFEESDARRAFPCFDHPVKKATFDVEMVIDEGLVAVSNGPAVEEVHLDGGRKLVKFQRTPKMSTYLLFFGVGAFEFIEDVGEVLVRVATMPGMTKYAQFGLEFGRKSLEFSENYYGIKYPLSKLDLIAISDFAAGAMENWGAITFRENLILEYPNITSSAGKERICEVIAHEMAHQWFGNLVSPSDWKYLWLNESFATFFGYGIVSHYHPEWDIWEQFLHSQTDRALDRDSLHETFPIEIPGGEHVVINASTAPIIYSKGGSILRQVEGYVGAENFKDGLRHYLKKHEYACASSHHLWEAIEEVSAKPVTKMMKSWIEQPGFPIVEVNRDGNKLLLRQGRFTYLPNDSEQEWIIPLAIKIFYKNGNSKTITDLLDSRRIDMDIGRDAVAYKVNHEQNGFYRVKYGNKKDLEELGKRVANKELCPEDRWGLQNDLYSLVRSGDFSMDDYLDFLLYYANEDAFLPLTSIAGNLFHAYLVVEGAGREKVASIGKSLLEGVLLNIGYEPRPDEKHTTSILRDQVIWHATLYGSENVSEFAIGKFETLMGGKRINPDIMRSVMQVGALTGDKDVFEWFDKRLGSSESEHERMNMLGALGCFKDTSLIEKAQQYALDKVPNRNKFIPIGYMAANPYAIPYMWEWYVFHLEELEQFHPMHYERVIGGIVPVSGIGKEAEIKAFFEDYMTKKDKAKDVIKLSLERLEINCRLKIYQLSEKFGMRDGE